jgi:hypothetical protein
MLGQKFKELPEVAGIGLQRHRRQPPFAAQMRQPARHLKRDAFIGAVEFDGLDCGSWFGHRLVSEAVLGAVIPGDYIAPLSFTVR